MLQGAIIGFGSIAQGHLSGYELVPELAATAIVDPCEPRRAVARARGLDAYASLDDLIDTSIPDFLDVCSPPDSHHQYISAAVGRRIPVLCEKPVFVPCDLDYASINDCVDAADIVVYPCQNYKFAPIFRDLSSVIKSGAIGVVTKVYIGIVRAGHALGAAEWYPDWRRDPVISYGGILRDHGPHSVYLATSLAGLAPCSVSCIIGAMGTGGNWTTEDTALLRMRCVGGANVEIDLTWAGSFRDSRYTFVGDAGYVSVENDRLTVSCNGMTHHSFVPSDFNDPSHRSWFAEMFREFHAAVTDPGLNRNRMRALLDESMLTTAVIDAGYESAANGGAWCDVLRYRSVDAG